MISRKLFLWLLCISTYLLLAGCNDSAGLSAALDEQKGINDSLVNRVQYLEDMEAIKKLQAKYSHYLLTQKYDRVMDDLYAQNSDDVSTEFSDGGVFRGQQSVRSVYKAMAGWRSVVPGFFLMHLTVDPYIVIARDGLSAKSHWLSPGVAGFGGASGEGRWVWGPWYVDYVKEDGEWRILHSRFVPVFRSLYEESFTTSTDMGTVRLEGLPAADEPPTLYQPYDEVREQTEIFKNHPELPEPY